MVEGNQEEKNNNSYVAWQPADDTSQAGVSLQAPFDGPKLPGPPRVSIIPR